MPQSPALIKQQQTVTLIILRLRHQFGRKCATWLQNPLVVVPWIAGNSRPEVFRLPLYAPTHNRSFRVSAFAAQSRAPHHFSSNYRCLWPRRGSAWTYSFSFASVIDQSGIRWHAPVAATSSWAANSVYSRLSWMRFTWMRFTSQDPERSVQPCLLMGTTQSFELQF